MTGYLKQSSTSQPLVFLLISSSDHVAPVIGATPTVTLSKNGGPFSAPAGTVSEIANGWYQVAGNATDTATLGALILHASATGTDPVDSVYQVIAFDLSVAKQSVALAATDVSGNVTADVQTIKTQAVTATAAFSFDGQTSTQSSVGNIAGGTTVIRANDFQGNHVALASSLPANLNTVVISSGQSLGSSTYAGVDTPGTGTLLSRVTGLLPLASDYSSSRATKLDNLDAAISTRSTFSGGAVASVTGSVNSVTTGVTVSDKTGFSLSSAAITALQSGLSTFNPASQNVTVGALSTGSISAASFAAGAISSTVAPNLDAAVSTRAAPGAAMDLVASPNSAAIAAIATGLLDLANGVESTVTVRQALRGYAAVLLGKSTGAGNTFRDLNDTKNRVIATVDSSNDRTAVTLNLT